MNDFHIAQDSLLEERVEGINNTPFEVKPQPSTPVLHEPVTLEEKIQRLIKMCSAYKEKYEELKKEHEETMTNNIELEDEKIQLLSEKHFLEQRVIQQDKELHEKETELNALKLQYSELNSINNNAVTRIDKLLAECDFDI